MGTSDADIDKSSRLVVKLGISQLVAQLLINRGIETEDAAHAYLYPRLDQLHSPFLLHGMEQVVERIRLAMKRGEQIWIFGDYDVDGTTATSLLISTFRHLDFPVKPYIPNRFEEGYGLNKEAIKKLKENGCDLLITVDCGITSIEEVGFANTLGIDVIITDHHQPPPGSLPPAVEVITPKMPESEYPFDGLAGVGLAFKLAHGLMGGGDLDPFSTISIGFGCTRHGCRRRSASRRKSSPYKSGFSRNQQTGTTGDQSTL